MYSMYVLSHMTYLLNQSDLHSRVGLNLLKAVVGNHVSKNALPGCHGNGHPWIKSVFFSSPMRNWAWVYEAT